MALALLGYVAAAGLFYAFCARTAMPVEEGGSLPQRVRLSLVEGGQSPTFRQAA